MESPYILLRTKEKDSFTYQNSYKGATILELETLLGLGQEIVRLLKAELVKRQVIAKLKQLNAITKYTKKLQKSVGNLKILGYLDKKVIGLITTIANILKIEQTSCKAKVYQTFLYNILRQCD